MANETKTAATVTAKAPKAAAPAKAASPFAGKSVMELIENGTPDAIEAARKLVAGSGVTMADLSAGNEWGNGVAHSTYSDCYKEDGSFETFMNSERAKVRKVSGRYLKDSSGRRVKFYNTYLRLLPEGVGVYNEALNVVLFDKVPLGIMATPDGNNLTKAVGNDGITRLYAGVIHSFAKKPFVNPPAIAPKVVEDDE